MTQDESIVEIVLAAVAAGTTDFNDLVDHCRRLTELEDLAAEIGEDPSEYLSFLLGDTGIIRITDQDRVVRMDLLLDGVVFTHRLSESEIADSVATAVPDLAGIDLDDRRLEVPGGTVRLEFDFGEDPHLSQHGSLVGPPGWLGGFSPGDLAAFRRQTSNLVVEHIHEVADGAEEVEAIRHAFDVVMGGQDEFGVEPYEILECVLIEHPELFRRPVPPVSELFTSAGIEVSGSWAGRNGTEWQPPGVALLNDIREMIHSKYELSGCCEEALDIVIGAWHSQVNNEPVDSRSANRALGHGAVVGAFAEWLDRLFGLDSPSIGELATTMAASGHRDAVPALLLRSRHYEAAGEALMAEQDLETAHGLNPDAQPVLIELAWYASDRGDATRTVSLLRRAGFSEDEPLVAFHTGLGTKYPAVGRNGPCPCGSGRKYKTCHLGRMDVTAAQRVMWLLFKLTAFVTRPNRIAELYGLASSAMLPDFEVDDLVSMVGDEFLLDLRVFEGGGVTDYLDERGVLLPEDERDLLELWEMARLGLWEVLSVDEEGFLSVRDTKTGETLDVADRSMARSFAVGEHVLTHFIPGWDHMYASGVALRIDLRHRDSVLTLLDQIPDADTIAIWYGTLFAPPSFSNRESEPMVLCQARLAPLGDWGDLAVVLDDTYDADEDNPGIWRELFEIRRDEHIVRATMHRDGDHLVVETNSEARLDRVLTRLADVSRIVSQDAKPARSLGEMREATGHLPQGEPAEASDVLGPDDVNELLDFMERRWLDEHVPALGGITPRQAADDPTRRADLIDLLRSFDRMPSSGAITMRPDVLRTLLGLSE